jgi:hypothetical protein
MGSYRDRDFVGTVSGYRNMDILDAQAHAERLDYVAVLSATDALGIRSVLIDEYWEPEESGNLLPGYLRTEGIWPPVVRRRANAIYSSENRFFGIRVLLSFLRST